MKQSVPATLSLIGAIVFLGCGDEAPPAQPIAGVGSVAGTVAAVGGTSAAGSGMIMNPVGAAGVSGPAGAGPAPAGTGATAGVGAAAGTGATAGVGAAAGTGATAGVGAAAGTGATAGMGAAGMPAFTPGSPTFSAIHQEIFVGTGCNGGPSCHSGTVAGALKLTNKAEAYTALVNTPALGTNIPPGGTNCKDIGAMRVVPGDPAKSLLLNKLEAAMPQCGARMPIGGMLKADQINQVKTWIMNGAKND